MEKNNLHKNKSGFKVPNQYFENFEKNLLNKLGEIDKDQTISELPSQSGFKVPKGYFDSLEDIILSNLKTDAEKRQKGKLVSLFSKKVIVYTVSIAAMIAIILSISINKKSITPNINSLDVADIQSYIIEGNIEFSTEDIASLLDENQDFDDTFENKSISDEEVLEYLSQEELDNELIFTE